MNEYYPRHCIVIDIETWPDDAWLANPEARALRRMQLRVPANYKKEGTIAAYLDKQEQEMDERASLSVVDGRICAIGYADLNSGDPVVLASAAEDRLLNEFAWRMRTLELDSATIAGWRVRVFDIPFIAMRCSLHEIDLPSWWPTTRDHRSIFDAAEVADACPGTSLRLGAWLHRFGLENKTADGSEVIGMSIDQIKEYCANDVRVERDLIRRMGRNHPQIRFTEELVA